MKIARSFTLLDGSMTSNHSDVVRSMAADLIRFDATKNEADAMRALMWTGRYHAFDVVALVPDAMQVAYQQTVDVVAKELRKL